MTLKEFIKLPLSAKSDLLYEWGYFISSDKTADTNTVLYAINGFFAEERISLSTYEVIDIKAYDYKDLSKKNLDTIRDKKGFLLLAPGVIYPGMVVWPFNFFNIGM